MVEWKTGNPPFKGRYLVTTRTALMVDYKSGSHSYVHETDIADFDGDWNIDGVIAWAFPPEPYFEKVN